MLFIVMNDASAYAVFQDIKSETLNSRIGSFFVVKWLFISAPSKRPVWGILAVPDHLKPGC